MLPLAVQNKNIFRLAAAQAPAGANLGGLYATGAIVGNAIAPSPSLATLPITLSCWRSGRTKTNQDSLC